MNGTALTVDIGPGEFLDRLSILAIKAEQLGDGAGTAIRDQHDALVRQYHDAFADRPGASAWFHEIRQINACLWELEDRIRVVDAQDAPAVAADLARQICRFNDARSEVKRRIDAACGAREHDVKVYHGAAEWGH